MENILSILFRNNYSKYFLEISRQVNWFDYCPPEIPMLSDLRSASTDFSRGDQPSEITKLSDLKKSVLFDKTILLEHLHRASILLSCFFLIKQRSESTIKTSPLGYAFSSAGSIKSKTIFVCMEVFTISSNSVTV